MMTERDRVYASLKATLDWHDECMPGRAAIAVDKDLLRLAVKWLKPRKRSEPHQEQGRDDDAN